MSHASDVKRLQVKADRSQSSGKTPAQAWLDGYALGILDARRALYLQGTRAVSAVEGAASAQL